MTTLFHFFSLSLKKILPVAADAPKQNSKPALQDDRALHAYLKLARNPVPGALFYRAARERILNYEAEQGRYGKKIVEVLSHVFATFMDQMNGGKIPPPVNRSLWITFLAYYKAGTGRAYAENNGFLQATYFARDVLLAAMAEDKDHSFNALTDAFREPACGVIERKYPNHAVDFADVYQDALISLFKKPPLPGKAHTAQLYSFFRTILVRRAADAFQQGKKQSPTQDLTDNLSGEGKNINGFTDHIIEANGLANLFGSDDIGAILSDALNQLGEDCRSILKLKYYQRLKQREIADKKGWSTNSVGTRISRCLTKLKDILRGGK